MTLKYRIATILALCALSVWALFPRNTIERVKRDGVFVYETVKRVPLKRGLDLQGGMHLSLEIDESKGAVTNKSEALDRALTVVRSRIDQFGVSEPVIQKAGNDRIIVELPGIDDPQRAIDVVQKSAYLEFQITDKSGALEKALPRIDAAAKSVAIKRPTGADTTARSTNALQDLFSKDTTATDSAGNAEAQTPGVFSKLIQQGQLPGEYYVASSDVELVRQYLADSAVQAVLPPGKVLRWSNDSTSFGNTYYRALYVLDARPIITGEYLIDAKATTSPLEGTAVQFTLNNEGGRRFRNETARHIQDHMAIVLDQQVMGQPPVIQSAIGTNGQITLGRAGLERAQDLALVLRAGALPAPLKVAEVRNIGPSLGQDSIDSAIRAGAIAIGLLFLIMVGYYRFSGFLAVSALFLYVLYTLAILAGFDAVLTLPGLAGFVLSIGMAIDANVLIFERIREELDRGRSVRLAIDEGFRHALPAIIDTNASSALTAAVLYQFGTGPVRGFAVTLMAGMASSMVSAVFVVRTFYMMWLSRASDKQALSI
jgi:preprotein translocase subunit SecD